MKKLVAVLLISIFTLACQGELFSQAEPVAKEFGLTAGGFTNFPLTKDYLDNNIGAFYLAPYLRAGRHEVSLGIAVPLATSATFFMEEQIGPRPGFIAGYKFYVFNPLGRENLFVHYTFQYLRFKGTYEKQLFTDAPEPWNERDVYFNSVIGLGYNLFFDVNERFGFYYILDYVISKNGYKLENQGQTDQSWVMKTVWNNLSSQVGFSFKLTSIK